MGIKGTRKFITKEVAQDADRYLGRKGEVWFQEGTSTIRFGDNITIGGQAITGGASDPLVLENTGVTFGVWLGDTVKFVKQNYGDQVDQIAPGIAITRGPQGGLFNPEAGDSYSEDVGNPYVENISDPGNAYYLGPTNTEWNANGWADLSDVTNRNYVSWLSVTDGAPPNLIGQELIMHDVTNDTYHTVKFLSWQYGSDGNTGGGFSYERREINVAAWFTKSDYGSEVDLISDQVHLTRDEFGAIYNTVTEESWDTAVSPQGTVWNGDGWDDLSDVTTREYVTFNSLWGDRDLDKKIMGKPLIMLDVANNAYWKIQFTQWSRSGNGGGFAYVRERVNVSNAQTGITFADGSHQTTAFTEQRLGILPQIKYTSSNSRWLSLNDIGKHIVVTQTGTNIVVPDYRHQPFPLGSAITIVNRSGGDIYVEMDNDDEFNVIYGAGTSDVGTIWDIPDAGGGNMATLLKIDTAAEGGDGHNWMISGPNITLNPEGAP